MLNPNLKLNQKMFDTDVEQVPIRKGFGEGLLQAAENDKRVVDILLVIFSIFVFVAQWVV